MMDRLLALAIILFFLLLVSITYVNHLDNEAKYQVYIECFKAGHSFEKCKGFYGK